MGRVWTTTAWGDPSLNRDWESSRWLSGGKPQACPTPVTEDRESEGKPQDDMSASKQATTQPSIKDRPRARENRPES